jgi:preprotein translocase subunit SecA
MIKAIQSILKKIVGDKAQNDLKTVQPLVDAVLVEEKKLENISIDELRQCSSDLKNKIRLALDPIQQQIDQLKTEAENLPNEELEKKEGLFAQVDTLEKQNLEVLEATLLEILPLAFAIVKETSKRFSQNSQIHVKASDLDRELAAQGKDFVSIQGDQAIWNTEWNAAGTMVKWNMVHYNVQLIGGIALHSGKVAEMATGEGKTLVATLPVFLNALAGRGVHLVTVNDYLAKRDSEWMGPLYQFHGLTVDCIDRHQPNSNARRNAYLADITFGTNNEFGFDYLRDNMATESGQLVQRKHHFAIVDEVDSVLIDEARTPLIISGPTPKGDQHEFDNLKPRVQVIINAQKTAFNEFLNEAKKKLQPTTGSPSKNDIEEGGLALFRAYRSFPKSKALIKLLSEEGMKAQLLKTEGHFLQDNQREMPKVNEELFFVIEEKNNQIELTDKGIALLSNNMEDDHFFVLPDLGSELAQIEQTAQNEEEKLQRVEALQRDYSVKSERIHTINQLLKAYALFEKDVDYVVMENKVKIVDEQTGRIMEGRRYSDGLHQAIEAKENVRVEAATQTYATITLQNYFRMYHKLAGMTGTAETEAGEFWSIYKLDVMVIPTHRNIQRKDENDKVYKTKREKYNAIIDEVAQLQSEGRPVLVGTTTVEVSELLSRMLKQRNIPHQVLNAKLHQKEAEIVALAGQAGTVTIATNMAGRGTDIKLGDGVKDKGLAIIGTERHDSRRVDRQLRGRSGRQGDPGSSQFYVSLEDDLMRLFGSDRIAKMMDRLGLEEGEVIQHSMITSSIERAQKKVEENHFGVRKRLLEFDDVMNAQREVIYKRRKHALFGERLQLDIDNMMFDLAAHVVDVFYMDKNYEAFRLESLRLFGIDTNISQDTFLREKSENITHNLYDEIVHGYNHRMNALKQQALPVIQNIYQSNQGYQNIAIPLSDGRKNLQIGVHMTKALETQGKEIIDTLEKSITLAIIDLYWKEHLRDMDDLRHNVQFASHEQKDPLLIYKLESYELFKNILAKINGEIIQFLLTCKIADNSGPAAQRQEPVAQQPKTSTNKPDVLNTAERNQQQAIQESSTVKNEPLRVDPKVGRNDPCPCGSGKKYKSCHGLAGGL